MTRRRADDAASDHALPEGPLEISGVSRLREAEFARPGTRFGLGGDPPGCTPFAQLTLCR